jgi:broad specificity phosphatase PhoE
LGAEKRGAGAQLTGWRDCRTIRYIAGMTRVFLARHAEPSKSGEVLHTNWPLSRFGRNQADHLSERLLEFAPLKVVSGPALRCKESAEFAAKRLGTSVKIDPRLGEIVPPRGMEDIYGWLLRTFNFAQPMQWGQFDANVNKWRDDNVKAISELKEDAVVFTHFANINVVTASALHLENTAVCRPDYASITEFSVVNGDIRLVMHGTEIKGPNE